MPLGVRVRLPGRRWGTPTLKYTKYKTYNLRNQYGVHRVLNNQTGGAMLVFCKGCNGTKCTYTLPANQYTDTSLTPINSLILKP
ncbi:hypothetical protein ACQEU6_03735 [Spirillospora sp. CA-108201]